MTVSSDIGRELLRDWQDLESAKLSPGERQKLRAALYRKYNMTRGTFYNTLHKLGWQSDRKPRRDKGRSAWPDETWKLMSKMMLESKRNSKGMIMTGKTTLDIMQENGVIPPDEQPSYSTAMNHLRRLNLSPRQMMGELDGRSAYNEMRTPYPNYMHQFDITNCVMYYFEDGTVQYTNMIELYKPSHMKKVVERKTNIRRFVLIDHYSGAFFVKYYETPGENTETIIEFLWEAWRDKGHEKYPFCGVPEILYTDPGPGNKSKILENLCFNLGVIINPHLPHNPRAKGAVEGQMKIWENSFESRMRIQSPKNIDELNDYRWDFLIRANGDTYFKHSRHGQTRSRFWFDHQPEVLRKVPERDLFLAMAHTTPKPRTVDGRGCISFSPVWARDKKQFKDFRILGGAGINPSDLKGKKVMVQASPFEYPILKIFINQGAATEAVLKAEPVERDLAGFAITAPMFMQADDENVKRIRHSKTQNAMRALEEIEVPQMTAFGYHAEKVTDNFMVPQGEVIGGGEPAEPLRERTASRFQVISALEKAGLISPMPNDIDREFIEMIMQEREQIPVTELERIIEFELRKKFNAQGGR